MTKLFLDSDTILKRLAGIQQELKELEQLQAIPLLEFSEGVGFKLAQFHLHRALEGVFHIGSHMLSRIPGADAAEYKAMAKKLGEVGVVEKKFAETILSQMAGYRNRLVHFYAEISPQEMYEIIQHKLGDFDPVLQGFKRVLEHPETFGIGKK